MRSSNQIAVLNELPETAQSPEFVTQMDEVITTFPGKLADRELRKTIRNAPSLAGVKQTRAAVAVGNYFESAGALVRCRIVDAELFCEMWADVLAGKWSALEEFTANRRVHSGPAPWENFEYLALVCDKWLARRRYKGLGFERKRLPQPWAMDGEDA